MSSVHRASHRQHDLIFSLFCFCDGVKNKFVYPLVRDKLFETVRAVVILFEPALDVHRAEEYVTVGALNWVVCEVVAELAQQVCIHSPRLALLFWIRWIGKLNKLWFGFVPLPYLSQLHFVQFLFERLYFCHLFVCASSDVRPHLVDCRLELARVVLCLLELFVTSDACMWSG